MRRCFPVAHLLKPYRVALGLTQAECAELCGLSRSHYTQLELGTVHATKATLKQLVHGLHAAQRRWHAEHCR